MAVAGSTEVMRSKIKMFITLSQQSRISRPSSLKEGVFATFASNLSRSDTLQNEGKSPACRAFSRGRVMGTRRLRLAIVAFAVASLALTACAPQTRVVLLPDQRGKATAVVVRTSDAKCVLDHPYASADVKASGAIAAHPMDAAAVDKAYGDILRLTPPVASAYSLEFLSGGSTLTPKSQAELDTILTAAIARPGGEVIINGHTDTTGSQEFNDRISQERASYLRGLLIRRGVPALRIQAIGRGQRELLVPTGLGVNEPRNRRVQITVR